MEQREECCQKLHKELAHARSYIAFLERQHQEPTGTKESLLEFQLRERVKELNCLYGLARLIEQDKQGLESILLGTVKLLPGSWQYPDVTCARIKLNDKVFQSENFKLTQWKQKSEIYVFGKQEGTVEVYYLKKKPMLDEGPFLKEERLLINAVSDHIARAIEKISTQQQLQVERQALQEANASLHDSLTQSQKEKRMVGTSIQAKIDKIITPIIYALQGEMNQQQLQYLCLIKKNLSNIISPFVENRPKVVYTLSPAELQVSNMIKHGMSSKEIANLRGTSLSTVNRHRESIRRKLGLTNRKANLVSYLNNVLGE